MSTKAPCGEVGAPGVVLPLSAHSQNVTTHLFSFYPNDQPWRSVHSRIWYILCSEAWEACASIVISEPKVAKGTGAGCPGCIQVCAEAKHPGQRPRDHLWTCAWTALQSRSHSTTSSSCSSGQVTFPSWASVFSSVKWGCFSQGSAEGQWKGGCGKHLTGHRTQP